MSDFDKYKVRRLIEVFEHAMLWGWYLSAAIVAACLWYFHLPDSSVQMFAFLGVFSFYTVLSIALTKVKQIETELS